MTDTQNIRLRPDGSIDTAYYLERGRYQRSEAAHEMAGLATGKTRQVLVGLKALIATHLSFGGRVRQGWSDPATLTCKRRRVASCGKLPLIGSEITSVPGRKAAFQGADRTGFVRP